MRKITFSIVFMLWAFATLQAQSLEGTIVDENGKALAAANVRNLQNGAFAVSDANGHFHLQIKDAAKGEIQITYVGYAPKSLKYERKEGQDKIKVGNIVMLRTYFQTEAVSVVATRTPRTIMEIPADISLIDREQMELIPSDKIDQNLKFTSGVFVDRPFGIFGKSVVGIRSVVSSEPGRQLTLLDGVPINKSDGGGTNWNRIIEEDFQSVEVLKGPGAAIYGNNAMGGVINLIPKIPVSKNILLTAHADYASFNTLSGGFNLMQATSAHKGFYYVLSGKGIKSDGYITVPDSIRDETDTSVFLKEYGFNGRAGYRFNSRSRLEASYNFYNENRGQGTKIKLEDGAAARYRTNFGMAKYTTEIKGLHINANVFYQQEHYERDIEKIKKGNYTFLKVKSDRIDYGLLTALSYKAGNHNLSFTADLRNSSVDGVDEYQTSSDRVINRGKMDIINLSLSDEWNIFPKFKTIIGLHYAFGHFYGGDFLVEESTSATDFMQKYSGPLDEKYWSGFSPRLAFQYDFSKHLNIYTLYSHGYRAPSLDDLTRYGFINIGYKKANPDLKPENLDNIELGFRMQQKKWALESNVNAARGNQFLYYVATGETMFGGRKKVYRKENVGKVSLYEFEINLEYRLNKYWHFTANYSLNGSEINQFDERQELEGKRLSYVPADLANLTLRFRLKKIETGLSVHYQGRMYLDEVNNFEVAPLMGLDLSLNWNFHKNFSLHLSGQNLLDEQHMVSNDQMSLGRYLKAGLIFNL